MIQERRSLFAAGDIDARGRDSLAGDFGGAEPIGQPATFGEAFAAARRDQTETRNHNARQFETENELWERHRQIEAALGRDMPLPQSLTGEPTNERDSLTDFLNDVIPADRINAFILGRPGSLTDDEYERQIEDLRREQPEAFRAIETRDALQRRLAERWLAIRADAETSAASGGWGAAGTPAAAIERAAMIGALVDRVVSDAPAARQLLGLADAADAWG